MSLADQIRARLDDPIDVALNGTPYVEAIRATIDLHREHRIYERCGHTHQPGEPGVRDVDEVGFVCEDGYAYSICWGCCTGETGFQSEVCASDHEGCWPCKSVKVIAASLGITKDIQPDAAPPSGPVGAR